MSGTQPLISHEWFNDAIALTVEPEHLHVAPHLSVYLLHKGVRGPGVFALGLRSWQALGFHIKVSDPGELLHSLCP